MDLLDDDDLFHIGKKGEADPRAPVRRVQGERRPLPDANQALRAWMDQGPEPGPEETQDGPEGQCHLCKTRAARYTCRQCGKGTCAEHQWVMFGLCRRCATEDRIKRWHNDAHPEAHNWLEDA